MNIQKKFCSLSFAFILCCATHALYSAANTACKLLCVNKAKNFIHVALLRRALNANECMANMMHTELSGAVLAPGEHAELEQKADFNTLHLICYSNPNACQGTLSIPANQERIIVINGCPNCTAPSPYAPKKDHDKK